MHLTFLRYTIIGPLMVMAMMSIPLTAQWTLLNSGTSETLNEIVFPAPDTGYVVGANGTVLRTFNGGNEWTSLDAGTSMHVNDLFFFDSRSGIIVGDSGLFSITYDAGDHWNTTYLMPEHSVELGSVFFTSPLTGFVGGRSNVSRGIILKTTDGGLSWEETITPASSLDVQYKRIVFPTPDIGYAITRGKCMKTLDGGDHWFVTDSALVSSGGMFSILEDAHFFSADTGFIVGWYNGFSGYTSNGGESWTDRLLFNNQWYSIDFPNREIGYLLGWGQLLKTADGGQTWADETYPVIGSGGIYSIDFSDEYTGYGCGENGLIIKTTSGGITHTKDIRVSADVIVYPNPSDGNFKIETNIALDLIAAPPSLIVYSSLGEKVVEVLDLHIPAHIHLEDQPAGLYLVVILSAQYHYTTKVLIH